MVLRVRRGRPILKVTEGALGPDGFGIRLLKQKENLNLRQRACRVLAEMANTGEISEHMRISSACYLSKNKSTAAALDDLRLIQIFSHLIKALEHMILAKLEQFNSAIIQSGDY